MLKEEKPRSDEGLKRKALVLTCALVLAALVVGSLFGDRGVLQLMRHRQGTEALSREIDGLRAENGRLAAEIAALRTDPRAIERLAREELALGLPGETLFLIRPDPLPDGP